MIGLAVVLAGRTCIAEGVLLKNDGLLPLLGLETFRLQWYCSDERLGHSLSTTIGLYKEDRWLPGDADDPRSTIRLFVIANQADAAVLRSSLAQYDIVIYVGTEPRDATGCRAVIYLTEGSIDGLSKVVQAIFGARPFEARLSQAAGSYPAGSGLSTQAIGRIRYPVGQERQPYQELEARLDSLLSDMLDSVAFPGAQLMAVHRGTAIVHKAYGSHTYDRTRPVRLTDLYDMASITKVSTAVPAMMLLYDMGRLQLDQTLCHYLPYFCKSDKESITLREMLTHQSGIPASIVYWRQTMRKNGRYRPGTFRHRPSARYPVWITDSLYLHRHYSRQIDKAIRQYPLKPDQGYVYSDLAFTLFPQIIARQSGSRVDDFLYANVYDRLGSGRMRYKPLDRFSTNEIVPTELDTMFRHTLVHGGVHDETGAMLDGLSCNAGLFSNANDLAKLCQMLLNYGTYAGEHYIDSTTIAAFTGYQFADRGNRRALGFDKPLLEYDADRTYVARSATPSSYGHTGYTGTYFWIDPAYDLIFILLTNRVHPTRYNTKIGQLNIRPTMQQMVYDFLRNT